MFDDKDNYKRYTDFLIQEEKKLGFLEWIITKLKKLFKSFNDSKWKR